MTWERVAEEDYEKKISDEVRLRVVNDIDRWFYRVEVKLEVKDIQRHESEWSWREEWRPAVTCAADTLEDAQQKAEMLMGDQRVHPWLPTFKDWLNEQLSDLQRQQQRLDLIKSALEKDQNEG